MISLNFYILDQDPACIPVLQDLIETDFDNSLVGYSSDTISAYTEILQLRVDILFISFEQQLKDGIDFIGQLKGVHSNPRIIMTNNGSASIIKSRAYNSGVDLFIEKPLNLTEVRHLIRLISSAAKMTKKMRIINDISSSDATPLKHPQLSHRLQMDAVNSILRFPGILSETKNEDIIKIITVMVDQKITFSNINFERDLHLGGHQKNIVFQRVRRVLRIGLTNLAIICIDYPENDILLEYANALFEYKNIHNEIQRIENQNQEKIQISIQHFFDGLLNESMKNS